MYKTLKLQEKLLQAGFKYARLCDTESTSPEVQHFTLEKDAAVDAAYCTDNVLISLDDEEAVKILDRYLNPTQIHPNPLEI